MFWLAGGEGKASREKERFDEECETYTKSSSEVYNKVFRMMYATGDQQCMRRTDHSCTWVKNMKHPGMAMSQLICLICDEC